MGLRKYRFTVSILLFMLSLSLNAIERELSLPDWQAVNYCNSTTAYGLVTIDGDNAENAAIEYLIEEARDYQVIRDFYEFEGEILENTIWSADTVRVVGDVIIPEGINLQISEGTRIEFTGYYSIEVLGSLQAIATHEEPIVFTMQYPEDFTYDQTHRGCWNGIKFPYTSSLQDSSIFEYCLFEYSKETGDDAQAGGVISLQNIADIKFENCTFQHNVADRGGAIACRSFSAPLFINNLFTNNYALHIGSVFYNEYSYPVLINNTITSNHSINADIWTPSCALTNFFSKPQLYNNILWDNPTLYFLPAELFEPRPYYYGFNDIDQEDLNVANLNLEPQFLTDLSLNQFSPCINAGEIVQGYSMSADDLMGNPRISGEFLDLGCFEFQYENGILDDLISASQLSVYPNPFNPTVNISFYLENTQSVKLCIYDIKGRIVAETSELHQRGKQTMRWNGIQNDGKSAASGIYLFQIICDEVNIYTKGCLLR